MSTSDLAAFIARVKANAKTKPVSNRSRRKARKASPLSALDQILSTPPRVVRDKWTPSAICYLTTTTHCKCGATSTQTNPYPLVRHYDGRGGLREEAFCGDPAHSHLPLQLEHREVDISNCHVCLATNPVHPSVQMDLFGDHANA